MEGKLNKNDLYDILKKKNTTIRKFCLENKIGQSTVSQGLTGRVRSESKTRKVLEELFEIPFDEIVDAWLNVGYKPEKKSKEEKSVIIKTVEGLLTIGEVKELDRLGTDDYFKAVKELSKKYNTYPIIILREINKIRLRLSFLDLRKEENANY